jgi:hypothetical protein
MSGFPCVDLNTQPNIWRDVPPMLSSDTAWIVAPAAPHAEHMPSHIFKRVG